MANPVYIEDGDIIRGPFKNDAEANHAMVTGTGPWRRREEMGASRRYQSLQVSPDGLGMVTDYCEDSIEDVWDRVNDQGSRWFFYPLPFVITAGGGDLWRKRIVSACEPFAHLEGRTVATAVVAIAQDPDYVAAVLS